MTNPSILPGIESRMVETPRLSQHVLLAGPADGAAVIFIHGNASSATFWEATMLALPPGYRGAWRSMHLGGRLDRAVARRLWPGWLERAGDPDRGPTGRRRR